jgi:hypothetical protein
VPRHCGWCSHPRKSDLEQRVLDGESFRAVASDAQTSVAAASRHWRLHVRPTLRAEVPAHLSTFARRLLDIADDASDLRERAQHDGDRRLALQAGRAEREALADVIARLGIDDVEAIEEVEQARAFVHAVHRAVADAPELAERLARELESQGYDDMADSVRSLIDLRPQLHAVPTTREITR